MTRRRGEPALSLVTALAFLTLVPMPQPYAAVGCGVVLFVSFAVGWTLAGEYGVWVLPLAAVPAWSAATLSADDALGVGSGALAFAGLFLAVAAWFAVAPHLRVPAWAPRLWDRLPGPSKNPADYR
ncbi:MAG: hypothetical protein JHC95_06765 [Solirubrobacteraceae bacterium]|nr:hypothetical protein [Solirubrobacteraceae bacterium]